MPHVSFAIDTILKDLNDLENEINRELSKESETGLPQIMAENGYAKQLGDIRERISLLLEKVKSRLSNLLRLRDVRGSGSLSEMGLDKEIPEALSELSQLYAVSERLQSLIATISLNLDSTTKSLTQTVTAHALNWIQLITSWIKRISTQLWNLLCSLLTPQAWKLGGSLSSGPFGLANASIEITFGP
ncbi:MULTISPECIES: hypothetical protein [Filomicrobium]|uniref:Uncharacterized protein n=1 Tax=Filomicrobium insigne TaxID=418854 RepID=A0A1H0NBM9_9HYPH|nr:MULTISPECIES: hypothetical protein [Filomicrobium]MCV0371306.1 hypothetical protein [Filomicrobium sp.]SDO89710.1 hypothetical protein SAMN04488061_1951 [Filomicrobium insigne]